MTDQNQVTLRQFSDEYLSWSKGVHRKNSYDLEKQAFGKFFYFIQISGNDTKTFLLSSVGTKVIDQFMAYFRNKGLKATSVNAYFRHLKAAFSKAKAWEYIEENPFFMIKQLRIEKKVPAFIPPEGIKEFISEIKNFDHRMMITGYLSTGRRRGELLYLKWSDIDFENNQYRVESSMEYTVKSHMSKDFPINDIFLDVLKTLAKKYGKDSGRVFWKYHSPNSVTTFVKRELIKGGYPKLKLHDLRHTFASWYLMRHGDIGVLRELMGHKNIATTMIYSHLTQGHLDTENNKIQF